jgi:hypothetical protein
MMDHLILIQLLTRLKSLSNMKMRVYKSKMLLLSRLHLYHPWTVLLQLLKQKGLANPLSQTVPWADYTLAMLRGVACSHSPRSS